MMDKRRLLGARRGISPTVRGSWLGLILALLLASAAAPAQAQGYSNPVEAAKDLATQGAARYEVGLFDDALKLYEQAYKLHPIRALIFNIAQCHRQLKNYERAIFLYRSYLRGNPDATNRQQVEEIITELERLVQEQKKAASIKPYTPIGVGPPSGTGQVALEQDTMPWYRRWWVWTIVGVVVAGAVVGGAVGGTRGGGTPQPVPAGSMGTMDFTFGARR
jgi:tetratricopeptide (TPR) repeat protein